MRKKYAIIINYKRKESMGNINLDEYLKRNYKYGIGNLYDENGNVIEIGEIGIFDDFTNNYHLYPKDKNVCEIYEGNMKTLATRIATEIKRKYNDCFFETRSEFDAKNNSKDNKIYYYYNLKSEKTGSLLCNREVICKLFHLIYAIKNNVIYEMSFGRFYIDKENKVNRVLDEIQFDMVFNKDGHVNKGGNGICYPTSYQSHSLEKIEKELKDHKRNNLFYNPKADFNSKPEDILKEFVEFINFCDRMT